MSRNKPKRQLRPRIENLESRSLLSSSAQFVGFSNVDTTGPTAAVGPGGYKNLDLKLVLPLKSNGQTTSLQYMNIAGPTGFQWTYGNQNSGGSNPQAAPKITVALGVIDLQAMTETYEISISPVVLYVDPNTGSTTTLTLPNNSQLSFTDEYTIAGANQTTDTPQSDPALVVTATGLTQFPSDSTPTLPTFGFETYPGTALAQTSNGYGQIIISNLPIGMAINTATAELSDVAGLYWNTGAKYPDSYGRGELAMSISTTTNTGNNTVTATIAFPPERDEAGTTMTFRFQLNNDSTNTVYVTDIAIPSYLYTDPNLRDGGPINPNTTPVMVSPTSPNTPNMVTYTYGGTNFGPVDIQTLLNSGYQNIVLTDGSTAGVYTINEELNIPSGMILQAADSNVTLMFTISNVTQGVINLAYSHITLEGFKIRFSNSSVQFVPPSDGQAAAIISDAETLRSTLYPSEDNQHSRVDLNIVNLNIQAPYVPFDRNIRDSSGDPDPTGVGNQMGAINTVFTIEMGQHDSGTITGNTIYGGTIDVYDGPWQISGNQVLGAVKYTLSDAAFSVTSGGHDITLYNNTVTDLNPIQNGLIDRFFTANESGYKFNLTLNHVGVAGAASGNIGLPTPNPNGSYSGNPRNNPEMILFEDYRKTFEGSVLAVGVSSSSTTNARRVISIPTSELALFTGGENNSGLVLTILDGSNVSTTIPIIQTEGFNSGETSPTYQYFLLATSLPQGTFDFDISPAYVNPIIFNNTINTSGTISTGLVLNTTIINAQITYNTFQGDQSSETTGSGLDQSQAIRFNLHGAHYQSATAAESFNVMSGTIDHNTVVNAIGGVNMFLDTGLVPRTYGRTYGFLTFTNNAFQYYYTNSAIISINTDTIINGNVNPRTYTVNNDSYSKLVNGSVVFDPMATYFIDPRTLVINASGNSVQWTNGASAPPTDVTVNAAEINGTLYEANANLIPPLLPLSTTGMPQVNLSSSFNKVGITADAATTGAGFDINNDTYSSIALTNSVTWDGQAFNIGSAGVNDVEFLGGSGIPVTPGNYTNLLLLGASNNGSQSISFTLNYSTGAAVTYSQVFSDWISGYIGGGTTAPGESIAKMMGYFDTGSGLGKSTTPAYLYGYNFPVDPTRTLTSITATNNNRVNILAADLVDTPPQVNLSSQFNKVGITADAATTGAGFDINNDTYSSIALTNSVTWDGQAFNIGSAGVNDVEFLGGSGIPVTPGNYTNLLLLGASNNGSQSMTFTLNYSTGQSVTYNQVFSDWTGGYIGVGTTAPGESIAKGMSYYDTGSGSGRSTASAYLYGYSFPVDPTRTLISVTATNNNRVNVLATDLVNTPPQVNLNAPGSATYTPTAFNQVGISTDGNGQYASLDNTGASYSANLLTNSIAWNGQTFNLGSALINDVDTLGGVSILVPQGSYTNLMLLGSAHGQFAETFTLNYSTGSSVTYVQTFSDWITGYNSTPGATAPGESIAKTLSYYNTASGKTMTANYVYGYNIPLDPTRILVSIGVYNDNNVNVLAADLVSKKQDPAETATYDSTTGIWSVYSLHGAANTPEYQIHWGGNAGDIPVAADFTGSGQTDLGIFRVVNNLGYWLIATGYNSSGVTSSYVVQWGYANQGVNVTPEAFDFTGAGHSDLGFYDSKSANWGIASTWETWGQSNSTGTSIISAGGALSNFYVNWGGGTVTPAVADYTGAGHADLGLYVNSSGVFEIATNWATYGTYSSPGPADGSSLIVVQLGGANYVPEPADYTGIGHAEMAVYLPSNGDWYIGTSWNSGTLQAPGGIKSGALFAVQYGGSVYIPIPADYTGAGHTDLAVYYYSASTDTWDIAYTWAEWAISNGPGPAYSTIQDQITNVPSGQVMIPLSGVFDEGGNMIGAVRKGRQP